MNRDMFNATLELAAETFIRLANEDSRQARTIIAVSAARQLDLLVQFSNAEVRPCEPSVSSPTGAPDTMGPVPASIAAGPRD